MPHTNFNDGHVANNIVPKTPKVETVGVNPQPMQYSEAGTNTNLANNRFAQTQPINFSEAGVNTNLPSNRFTQTHEGKVDMQSVNIPNQNQISTHNYTCKCEDDVEMDQMGIQYRSDFAR